MTINPTELLYCVDEDNNPIKPVERQVAHRDRVWHRVSHIWVVSDKGRILCQRRSMKKDQSPGVWEPFFGGHYGPDMEAIDAALTELKEELGLKCDKEMLKPLLVNKAPRSTEFQYAFVVHNIPEHTKFNLEVDEVDATKWMDIPKLKVAIYDPQEQWSQDNREYELKCMQIIEQGKVQS